MPASVSIVNLAMAYRKAKVDLFYSSNPRRLELVEYEENLGQNLNNLLDSINSSDEKWSTNPAFVGTFTFAPKRLDEPADNLKTFWSTRKESWRRVAEQQARSPRAQFRLMSLCSIDFHVLSTLWMMQVGSKLDSRLQDNAIGGRLRRGPAGRPNVLGTGSFLPYQPGYQRWRDSGLEAMTSALDEGKSVIALTADVTSFYHRLDPGFLADPEFYRRVLGVRFDTEQAKLTRLFLNALRAWSSQVAAETGWRDGGIPVGLPASAVVANLALAELDDVIVNAINPIYYGRYVDDILLVVEDPGAIGDQHELWEWLIARSRNLLTRKLPLASSAYEEQSSDTVYFTAPYLQKSIIAFENTKNKSFHLEGRSGFALVESIRASIRRQSSEWRLLANVPTAVDRIESVIASARKIDGDEASTLRDADRASARKQSFAVRLRDFESFERNLPPSEWEPQRREFYRVACEHVLSLPSFFELATYLPRLVALAASCGDREALTNIFSALAQLPEEISRTCRVTVAAFYGDDDGADSSGSDPVANLVLQNWSSHLIDQAQENFVAGWRGTMSSADMQSIIGPLREVAKMSGRELLSVAVLRDRHRKMAQRDLAHRPYRWSILALPGAEKLQPVLSAQVPLDRTLEIGLDLLVNELKRGDGRRRSALKIPGSENAGLLFATRPPNAMELFLTLRTHDKNRFGVADSHVIGKSSIQYAASFRIHQCRCESRLGSPRRLESLSMLRGARCMLRYQ